MSPDQLTPSDVVLANVRVYMRWRGLTQKEVAKRMTKIGMGFDKEEGGKTEWHRRTVGQMLSGERRIDVNELFALAVALETTVPALLSPQVGGIVDFDMVYRIGVLDPLGVSDFEILLEDLAEKEARPRLVLGSWPTGEQESDGPRWVKQKTPIEQSIADAMEALKARHPGFDFDKATVSEIFALAEEDSQEA